MGGGAKLFPSGSFSNLSPATDPLPQGRQKGMRQEGGRGGSSCPPQTSDPINGLAWGQAAWLQRPLCPAAPHPHLGVRTAREAKTFRSTKPARQSWDGGARPQLFLFFHTFTQMCCLPSLPSQRGKVLYVLENLEKSFSL